jgi:UDP-N-acetylmuramate--alanine ligase
MAGLDTFRGVDRRFQIKGVVNGITVVDDYGHHPTEIRATLRAARDCGFRRVHVLFQPHRFTRTRDLMAEFATAFADADTAAMLDIYAASEEPIMGVDTPALVKEIGRPGVKYAESFDAGVRMVTAAAQEGDVILTLGAGNVSGLAPKVLDALAGQ